MLLTRSRKDLDRNGALHAVGANLKSKNKYDKTRLDYADKNKRFNGKDKYWRIYYSTAK